MMCNDNTFAFLLKSHICFQRTRNMFEYTSMCRDFLGSNNVSMFHRYEKYGCIV
jgi:hypothetical protein